MHARSSPISNAYPAPRAVPRPLPADLGPREQERWRLCREIHDGVLSSLAGTIVTVGAARTAGVADVDHLLAELEHELIVVIQELRLVVEDLRPQVLELGLASAVRLLSDRLGAGTGVRFNVAADLGDSSVIPPDVELAAYRIATEALTNVARHAQATACQVTLVRDETSLHVAVRDDGVGLPPKCTGGIGFRSMADRARELGGHCSWHSRPRRGTRIDCRLPVPPR